MRKITFLAASLLFLGSVEVSAQYFTLQNIGTPVAASELEAGKPYLIYAGGTNGGAAKGYLKCNGQGNVNVNASVTAPTADSDVSQYIFTVEKDGAGAVTIYSYSYYGDNASNRRFIPSWNKDANGGFTVTNNKNGFGSKYTLKAYPEGGTDETFPNFRGEACNTLAGGNVVYLLAADKGENPNFIVWNGDGRLGVSNNYGADALPLQFVSVEVTEVPLAADYDKNTLPCMSHAGELGYLSTSSEHYSSIQSATTLVGLNKEIVAITANDLVMPKDGGIYRIKNVDNSGAFHYLYIDDQNHLAASADDNADASGRFIYQKTVNGYILVSAKANGHLKAGATGSAIQSAPNGGLVYLNVAKTPVLGRFVLVLHADGEAYYQSVGVKKADNTIGYWSRRPTAGVYQENSDTWSTSFIFEEITSEATDDWTAYTASTTAGNDGKAYATLNLPFAVTVPEGVTANKVALNADGNGLEVTKLELTDRVLPANTPVLLTSDAATEYSFSPAASAAASAPETGLQGTLGAKAVTAGNAYILAKKDGSDEVKFYLLDSTDNTVNANKAYFVNTTNSGVRALALGNGAATGIEAVSTGEDDSAPVYDLQGRRVQKAVAGLYIRGGKKIFVK